MCPRFQGNPGPNEVANGLCLCSIHHKLFDKGVLGLTDQQRITVSARFVGRSKTAQTMVLSLNDVEMSPPMKGFPAVAVPYIAWHCKEVFRSPARAA